MSVAFSPGIAQRRDLDAVDDQPDDDRADQRADEGADDAAPEAVGQEDREVPDREAHHHPAEQSHQRALPWRLLRGRRGFWRGLGSSLSTRSSGVRSAAGSRSGAAARLGGRRWRAAVGGAAAGARPRGARLPASPSTSRSATSSWNSSREICWPGSSGASGCPRRLRLPLAARARRPRARPRRSWRRRAPRRARARCARGGCGRRPRAPSSASAPARR